MSKQEDVLEGQVPAYGFEALVSVIEDDRALIGTSRRQASIFLCSRQRLDGHTA